MRILITGASGAMSHYLVEYIRSLNEKHEIYGVSRSMPKPPSDDSVDFDGFIQHDLSSPKPLDGWLSLRQPEIVFHLASIARVGESFNHPSSFVQNNIIGTTRLFESIARVGLKPRIVICSTSEVYGNVGCRYPARGLYESEEKRPVNPYAVTKCAQEMFADVFDVAYGLSVVITRAFGYINPLRSDLVATSIARQLVECERGVRKQIEYGNTSPVRSFCDVRDIAEAYWLAATKCKYGVYNIGSSIPTSIQGLINQLEALSTASPEWIQCEALKRPTDIFYAVPNIERFQRETGWTPKIRLSDSLKWLMQCERERQAK